MRYFLLLLCLRLKAGVRGAYFLGSAALLVAFSLAFCLLLPERNAVNLTVGLLADESAVSAAAAETLLANEDYDFILYHSVEAMTRDAAAGRTHCAYALDSAAKRPVTLYAATDAYMTPVLSEVVLAAYLEALVPQLTAQTMALLGVEQPGDMAAYLEQVRAGATPVTIELLSPGGTDWPERYAKSGLYPLLYALLSALFVLCAVQRGLLRGERPTQRPPQGPALAGAVAPVLADVLQGLCTLVAADFVVALLYPALPYTLTARVAAFTLLAALAALLGLAARACTRAARLLQLLLPPVSVAWVLLSGAVVSPQLLPAGLSALRFLCPPWYVLRLLALLSQ